MNDSQTPAILRLEDGRTFRGYAFGAPGETVGEVCFNTGMTGYQEILTDPSYSRQIVVMTSPHIGNYGVNPDDIESDRIQVAGFIIREETEIPSNPYARDSIGDYLRNQSIVGIQGIDTRALVRHVREHGAMNGIISTVNFDERSLQEKLDETPSMVGLDLCMDVTCDTRYDWSEKFEDNQADAGDSSRWQVAAIDYGMKFNITRLLSERGCDVTVFPADAQPEDILDINPDGVFLSNGPGDPAAVTYGIETIKKLLGKRPIFGICLGHQLLGLAGGGSTYKLKFGHHGLNHPVKNLDEETVEITSQNHGFAVDPDSLPSNIEITHMNLNDDTVEGLRFTDFPVFSVQYHPEASPGPHDSRYLFNHFTDLMKEHSQ